MKLFHRLSIMTFMLILYNISYSMNQTTESLSTVITFRNSIVDVNQYRQTQRLSPLLRNLLTSLAPNGQNLTCFPLITILRHKDIYHESMKGNWAPNSQQIDVYYKDYYALTKFIPTKPSDEVSLAIGKLTQFASKMNYENLIISIRPIIPKLLIKTESDAELEAQLEKNELKFQAMLEENKLKFQAMLEKNELEFQAMLKSIFPTITPIVQIVTAPEPQPLSHESDTAWRRTPVAQTPAQILAPQNPAIKTVRSFTTRQIEVRQQIGQLQRITKLFNTPQTSHHSSSSNQS